jgi:Skp family chaperone for outer membrane proteins
MQQQGVQQLGLQTLEDEIRKEEEALKPLTQNLTKEALDKNPTLQERVTNLQKKQAEFVQKAQALNANLGQADGAASDQFIMAMMPAVKYVAEQAKAEVVLSSNAIWYGAPAVDLSSKVVQRLDATVPSYEAWVQAMQAQQAARAPAAGAAGVAPPAPR